MFTLHRRTMATFAFVLFAGGGVFLLVHAQHSRSVPAESRIEYFSKLYTTEPLFALDGTDPDLLGGSIEALQEATDKLAESYAPDTAAVIRRDLYPMRFLGTLPTLQRVRKAFLDAPDAAGLDRYMTALQTTADLYVEDLEARQHVNAALLGDSAQRRYVFVDGTLTPELIGVTFAAALESARRSAVTVRNDRRCAEGARSCRALPPQGFEGLPVDTGGGRTLTEAEKNNEYILRTARKRLGNSDDGQVVLLPASSCVSGATTSLAVLVDPRNPAFPGALQINELQDIYFWELASTSKLSASMEAVRRKGVGYLRQTRVNPYVCNEGAEVFATAATLLAMRDAARAYPIANNEEKGSDVTRRVYRAEKRVAGSDRLLAAVDADEYVRALALLVSDADGESLSGYQSPEKRRLAEERISMWKNRSGNFDSVLRSVAQFDAAVDSKKIGVPAWSPEYLFVARSQSRATFLFFNPSFMADPVPGLPEAEFSGMKLIPYSAMRQPPSAEELIDVIVRSEKIYYGDALRKRKDD